METTQEYCAITCRNNIPQTVHERPPNFYLTNHIRKMKKTCGAVVENDELICDLLSVIPTHKCANVGLPAKTFIISVGTQDAA